jgi:hypothetical protein
MENPEPTPSRTELSKTPSWIMLGFVLGMLTVLGFRKERASPPVTVPPAQSAATVQPEGKDKAPEPAPQRSVTSVQHRPSLAVIEAVFAEWGGYAIWEDEVTEVALWNSVTNDFTDYFEVFRTSSGYFFRSTPRLTRPWTDARPPRESPLRFTEPLELRRARLEGRLAPPDPVSGRRAGPGRGVTGTPGVTAPDYLPPPPAGPADSKH